MVSTVLQLAAIVVFPIVVSGTVAYLAWGDLRRPWLYFVVATVVLYAVYGVTFLYLRERIAAPTEFGLLRVYAKPLLGFSVMALPILAGIYTFFRRSE